MSRTTGVLLVVLAGLVMVWRAPVYLVAPNLWAEEGLYFFATAWNGSWLAAVVQRPATYLHLYANLATLAAARAGLVSLTLAPRVTAVAGLVAQLVPVAVVAFGRAPEWGAPWRRAVAVAIVLFGARTGGIWMNSVTAQNYLALTAFLLALEPPRGFGRALLLALCGSSGPGASFAAPLYVWRAARERSRWSAALAAIIVGAALVQAASFWTTFGTSLPGRGEAASVPVFAAIVWKRVIVASMAGIAASERFRAGVAAASGGAAPVGPLAGIVLGAALVLVIAALGMGVRRGRRALVAGAFVLATASVLGAVGEAPRLYAQTEANQRYFFAPSVLFLLLLLANVRRGAWTASIVCGVLVVAGLSANAYDWRSQVWWRPLWARWPDEVRAWEADPRRPLQIWPYPWTTRLRPRAGAARRA